MVTSHDWFGCPVAPPECGFPANTVLANAPHSAAPPSVFISLFILILDRSCLCHWPERNQALCLA